MKTTVHRNDEKSRTAIDIEVTFDPATLTTTDTPFGVMVRLEDCHPSGEIGGPALPARVLRVALPHGTEATSVTARIVSKVRALSGPVFIAPLQAARPGVKKNPPTKRKRAEKFHDHTRPCPPDKELRKERIHIDRLKEPLLAEPLPPAAFIG